MKTILLLTCFALITSLSFNGNANSDQLAIVKAQHVCMVNDRAFESPQIPVSVGDKTYYGCCPMCKAKLETSVEARTAIDPVSLKPVDKANASYGATREGTVFYFENDSNLKKYRP